MCSACKNHINVVTIAFWHTELDDGVCVSSNVHTLTDIFICVYMCMCTHDASSISELVS